MNNRDLIYLDTYLLQQDMRIRMPKCILSNLNITKGKTEFDVFFDKDNRQLILRLAQHDENEKDS